MNPSEIQTINDRQLMSCRRALAYRHRRTLPDAEYQSHDNGVRQAADRALQTVIAEHLTDLNWPAGTARRQFRPLPGRPAD